jgi:hypothetical protein
MMTVPSKSELDRHPAFDRCERQKKKYFSRWLTGSRLIKDAPPLPIWSTELEQQQPTHIQQATHRAHQQPPRRRVRELSRGFSNRTEEKSSVRRSSRRSTRDGEGTARACDRHPREQQGVRHRGAGFPEQSQGGCLPRRRQEPCSHRGAGWKIRQERRQGRPGPESTW